MPKPVPLVVGLVGGIGSGKSFVRRCFEKLGAVGIDADAEAHEALSIPAVRDALVAAYSPDILDDSGAISRPRLAARAFATPDATAQLNDIVHPATRTLIGAKLAAARANPACKLVILDVSLLLRSPFLVECHRILFVDTPESVRLKRVTSERGWSAEEFRRREALQNPLAEKRAVAHEVLDNSRPQAEIRADLRALYATWVGI